MDYKKNLVIKYGDRTNKKKSFDEFCRFIEEEFRGKKINFGLVLEPMRTFLFYNIRMYMKTHGIALEEDKLDIYIYIIPNKGLGKRYYEEKFVNSSIKGYNKFIYVALVKQLDYYMESNSSILFIDLAIERGISDKEKEKESILYVEYLSRIDAKENNYYKNGIEK